MSPELVARLAEGHSVQRVCKVLGVSRSGYYARRARQTPARVREDRRLKQQILAAHTAARGRYGTPRIEQELRRQGVATSRKRVARLRRELELRAKGRRRFRVTTDSRHSHPPAPNRLQRRFRAKRPNQVWVGDITYLAQGHRWLYLAVLMDLHTRRIVGWALGERIDEQLTLTALRRAVEACRPPTGLIHHSDRGAQYASRAYRRALEAAGAVASMSRRGDCWDNAPAESLIKTIKAELGRSFLTRELAQRELFEYIEGFYNTRRLHSGLGYRTPLEAELKASANAITQTGGALSQPAVTARASASPHPQIR